MGDRYSAGLQQTGVSTTDGADGSDSVGELLSTAAVRPGIYDILFGHGSAPADTVVRWEVPRGGTASATGTPAVENALDPGAPTAECVTEEEITASSTIIVDSQLLDFDLNQRATFRWVAAPGSELKIAAVATDSIFFNASSASYTGIARVTVLWEE